MAFDVYSVGLVAASVCTDLDDDTATQRLNETHPTGIASRWTVADASFADGTPNPGPCARPGCRHVLFAC